MPSVCSLPQELIDMSIDHLRDEPASLKACALTSRSWTYRSQTHLHRTILVICRRNVDPDRYSSPHVARLVRNLKIVDLPPFQPGLPTTTTPGNLTSHIPRNRRNADLEPFHDVPAWKILSRLTEIQELFLVDCAWDLTHTEKDAFADLFHNIKSLRLLVACFEGAADFGSFLSCFPCLCRLEMTFVCWDTSSSKAREESHVWQPRVIENCSRLSNIVVGKGGCDYGILRALAQWLSPESGVTTGADTMTFSWFSEYSAGAFPELLQAMNSSLVHLVVDVCYGQELAETMSLYPRKNGFLTAMQTLVFDNVNLHDLITREFTWIPSFLMQVGTTSVRLVEFRFDLSRAEQLDTIQLPIIDDILTCSRFPGLERVCIVLRGNLEDGRDVLYQVLQKRLTQAYSRGLLRVQFVEEAAKIYFA